MSVNNPETVDFVTQVKAEMTWPERIRFEVGSFVMFIGVIVMPGKFNEATFELLENAEPPVDPEVTQDD